MAYRLLHTTICSLQIANKLTSFNILLSHMAPSNWRSAHCPLFRPTLTTINWHLSQQLLDNVSKCQLVIGEDHVVVQPHDEGLGVASVGLFCKVIDHISNPNEITRLDSLGWLQLKVEDSKGCSGGSSSARSWEPRPTSVWRG